MCTKTPIEVIANLTQFHTHRIRDWVEDFEMSVAVNASSDKQFEIAQNHSMDWETWDYLGSNFESAKEFTKACEGLALGVTPIERGIKATLSELETLLTIVDGFIEIVQDADLESYIRN